MTHLGWYLNRPHHEFDYVRQYPANFSVTSCGLWLPLPCGFFSISPRIYSKSSYFRYTNVPNSALPSMSFLKRVPSSKFQVPSSKFHSQFSILFPNQSSFLFKLFMQKFRTQNNVSIR